MTAHESMAPAHVRKLASCPDLLALHASAPDRYPVLLQSSGGIPALARYDILFAFPGAALVLDNRWNLTRHPAHAGMPERHGDPTDFLRALDQAWRTPALHNEQLAGGDVRLRQDDLHGAMSLPFQGGWFVFLSYEMAQQIEPGLGLEAAEGTPVAQAVRVPAALIRDRHTETVYALAEAGRRELLNDLETDVRRLAAAGSLPQAPAALLQGGMCEEDPAAFLAAVRKVRAHIAAGDVYQANISRQWDGTIAHGVQPWMLYDRLRVANPAPFAALAVLNGTSIISSSPERLLHVREGHVETRPIAGTRARVAHSRAEHAALVENPKERAEHIMLIDLERNDLGRVCEPGSVRVDEFMVVESYAHVHHIVSNVTGRLRAGTSPGDVLRATFPGGTITGCPKVRCMTLIRELEAAPRGVYTGSLGYLNHDGSCDFNILIRTMTLHEERLTFRAGSGIVADSVPELELEETRAKAKGMLLAVSK